MKDIVKNIDFKVLQLEIWVDLQEAKLSGKSIWNKLKEKHQKVMVTFSMDIKESVEGGVVVYEAFTPQPKTTKGT